MLRGEMWALVDPDKAKVMRRFFKTGPGQYGQGDIFRVFGEKTTGFSRWI
jgi:hypothetical protein